MKRMHASIAALLLVIARPAWAWNATGHEIIAEIAWERLTPPARAKVAELLRGHPDFTALLTRESTPADARDHEAFLVAATWPDLVRSGPRAPRYSHPAWHYIDFPYVVEAGFPLPPAPDPAWKPGTDPDNAAQAYTMCLGRLRDERLPTADRAVALAWIEHLVGDIHQPLHATSMFSHDLPEGDKGGNSLMVTANSSVTNLHAFWDNQLGNYQNLEIIGHIAQRLTATHPADSYAEALKSEDFVQWAKASYEQAKSAVYIDGKITYLLRDQQNKDRTRPVPEVSPEYVLKAKQTAEVNAALAGYRLARVLNEALATREAAATAPATAQP